MSTRSKAVYVGAAFVFLAAVFLVLLVPVKHAALAAPAFTVIGVVAGALISSGISRSTEREKDIRSRTLSVVSEIIGLFGLLSRSTQEMFYHAPRGGGKVRTAGSDEEWTDLDPDIAREHDEMSAALFVDIQDLRSQIKIKGMELGVLGTKEARISVEKPIAAIDAYFSKIAEELSPEMVFQAEDANRLLERFDELVEDALEALRNVIP